MDRGRGSLPGWSFEIEERSAGVYRVRGTDLAGRTVEITGTDPDTLLERCCAAAEAMTQTKKLAK
jgi:hypothetical protein